MINFDYIDHISYIFHNIDDGYNLFKGFPGFRICKGPSINSIRRFKYLFIRIHGSSDIALIEPIEEESFISNQLKQYGAGLYCFCYACKDLEKSLDSLTQDGLGIVISKPKEDPAFDGRRVVCLRHKKYGLIELVESYSDSLGKSNRYSQEKSTNVSSVLSKNSSINITECINKIELPIEIQDLINDIIDEKIDKNINSFADIEDWDSLSMSIFHANFESLINERIDFSEGINNISFYIDKFDDYSNK